MRFNHTLSAILRGTWLLDPSWAELHAPLALKLIAGEDVDFGTRKESAEQTSAIQLMVAGYKVGRYTSLDRLPHGSVAIVDITGPIVRYGECSAGLEDTAMLVRRLAAADNISAIVFNVNSPGGEASGTASFASLIKSISKPTIGFVDDGIAASAGMWIISACDEIYASNTQSRFGSIGAYCSLWDMKKAMEARGIVVHEIYAPQSKDKNKEYRDALEGNYAGIEANLEEMVNHFIGDVRANRSGKLNLKAGDPFTGKMFNAGDSIKIGIIDGIMSIEQVIGRAGELAQKKSKQKPSNNMANEKKYPAIAKAAAWENGYEVTETGLHLTHEDAALVETALSQGATDAAAVTGHAEVIATKDARIQELEQAVATERTAKEAAEATVAQYAGKPHNNGTETPATTGDPKELKQAPEMDEVTAAAMKIYNKNKHKATA